jgi:hypothetical protein
MRHPAISALRFRALVRRHGIFSNALVSDATSRTESPQSRRLGRRLSARRKRAEAKSAGGPPRLIAVGAKVYDGYRDHANHMAMMIRFDAIQPNLAGSEEDVLRPHPPHQDLLSRSSGRSEHRPVADATAPPQCGAHCIRFCDRNWLESAYLGLAGAAKNATFYWRFWLVRRRNRF